MGSATVLQSFLRHREADGALQVLPRRLSGCTAAPTPRMHVGHHFVH